ncbi:MAG: PmoA family protein [Candidatus Hydrogenedentota bacterium]
MSNRAFIIGTCITLLITVVAMCAAAEPATLDAALEPDRIVVSAGGEVAAAYTFTHDQKYPYFYPVNGPATGESVTTESSEPYPHHHSLFFGCDKVEGHGYAGNYWQAANSAGQILSQGPKLTEEDGRVIIEDVCLWKRPEKEPIIRDERRIVISAPSKNLRIIDFTITLNPLTDVRINKSNHSLFSARMVPELSVEQGGTLVNAEGAKNAEGTFGKKSPWCAYYGTRGGETEGLAILQHPSNRWHPAPWFTRDYGFFSPTPIYWLEEDHVDLAEGEPLTLRYRVLVFAGTPEDLDIAREYERYAAEK